MTSNSVDFSVVSPVYCCKDCLLELVQRLESVFKDMQASYEILLVDDRCPQDSWSEITTLAGQHASVKGIRLSKNSGQHVAIQAGLAEVCGEWVVVLDCDLQDVPEEIPNLFRKAQEGFEVVRARRRFRNDPWHRRLGSKVFYAVLSYLTETKQTPEVANFGIYHRKIIDVISSWTEEVKFFPAIVQWVGFRQTEVEVEQAPRYSGESAYNFMKLLRLGVNVVLSFSDKPLRIIVLFGLLISLVAALNGIAVFTRAMFSEYMVPGWATTVLSVWFLGGVNMTLLGVASLYIGRISRQVKGRPQYIVDERRNS